jgi:hypothetical protein
MKFDQIYLDQDGVVADLMTGIEEYLGWPIDRTDYSLSFLRRLQMTSDELFDQLGYLFWASLPKTEDAELILSLVEPYKPILLSAHPGVDIGHCIAGKIKWLEIHMEDYVIDNRYMFSTVQGKLKLAHPGALLIDDLDENVHAWRAKGGTAILVPRPHNSRSHMNPVVTLQEDLVQVMGDDY